METKNFISEILDQLQDLKSNANKKHYVVQELEFELSFVAAKSGTVSSSGKVWDLLIPVTAEGKYSSDNIQKVKIRLKPKQQNTSKKIIDGIKCLDFFSHTWKLIFFDFGGNETQAHHLK